MFSRRQLLIAALAVIAPRVAAAQARVWRIGFVTLGSRPEGTDPNLAIFVGSMRELGYVEGNNLIIDWRFAEGSFERLTALASDLVAVRPDLIVAWSTQAVQAAQQASGTIPIVMVGIGDPVAAGIVRSLARPGGNITGPANVAFDLGPQQLQLLQAALPGLARVALLVNPKHPNHAGVVKEIERAASGASIKVFTVQASRLEQLGPALARLTRRQADALLVAPDPLFLLHRKEISASAAKNGLPTMGWNRDLAEAGLLMSYGQNLAEQFRHAAGYVDRILKGARPGDLPIEQPTKLEFIVNLKTARVLGVSIPKSLLVRTDEVIR